MSCYSLHISSKYPRDSPNCVHLCMPHLVQIPKRFTELCASMHAASNLCIESVKKSCNNEEFQDVRRRKF